MDDGSVAPQQNVQAALPEKMPDIAIVRRVTFVMKPVVVYKNVPRGTF